MFNLASVAVKTWLVTGSRKHGAWVGRMNRVTWPIVLVFVLEAVRVEALHVVLALFLVDDGVTLGVC